MNSVKLIKAAAEDVRLLYRLQREAFMPLYLRYRDDETSPVKETVERVFEKIMDSDFHIIYLDDEPIGGVRVRRFVTDGEVIRHISPIFLIPAYWDKGIGSVVMGKLFEKYTDADKWSLATIEQDGRNCHFYEKLGFVRTGSSTVVNDKMTIIGFEKKC